MREIKFRAWDKERKDMREVQFMDWSAWWVSTGSAWERGNTLEYGERNSFKNEETDRHALMQYTGLKDKNGVEIYEGDIVKGQTYVKNTQLFSRFIGEVKYYAPGFELDGVGKYKHCREELNRLYEVIGSIYTHPHLLGSEKN